LQNFTRGWCYEKAADGDAGAGILDDGRLYIGTRQAGANRETARVGERIEHFGSGWNFQARRDIPGEKAPAVVPLIEEKPGRISFIQMEFETNPVFENAGFSRGLSAVQKDGGLLGVALQDFVEDRSRGEAARPIFDLTKLRVGERSVRLGQQAIAQSIQIQPRTLIRRSMHQAESIGRGGIDERVAQRQL